MSAENPPSVKPPWRHREDKVYPDTGERQVFFVVVGGRGAVTTSFFDLTGGPRFRGHESLCAGIDFHTPGPRYEGQELSGPCNWIEAEGYCNGTSLTGVPAEEWFDAGDEERIFEWLEAHYASEFGCPPDPTFDLTSDRFGHGAGAERVTP